MKTPFALVVCLVFLIALGMYWLLPGDAQDKTDLDIESAIGSASTLRDIVRIAISKQYLVKLDFVGPKEPRTLYYVPSVPEIEDFFRKSPELRKVERAEQLQAKDDFFCFWDASGQQILIITWERINHMRIKSSAMIGMPVVLNIVIKGAGS